MYKMVAPLGYPKVSLDEQLKDNLGLDRLPVKLDAPDDFCCPRCLDNKEYGPIVDGECLVHGRVRPVPRRLVADMKRDPNPEFNRYVDEIQERIRMSTGTAISETKSTLAIMPKREEVQALQKRIVYALAGIKDQFGSHADAAAAALAQMAATYELDPFRHELYLIPTRWEKENGKRVVVDWNLYVGYRGMDRGSRRKAREEGAQFVFGEKIMLDAQEIEGRRSNLCNKCAGTGKVSFGENEYKCKKCDGQAKFPPDQVIGVIVPMYVTVDKAAAQAVGIPYTPTYGVGIWQPGDNIPHGRDGAWMAEKRARVDAMNQRWQLPFIYDDDRRANADIVVIESDAQEADALAEMAAEVGITYDTRERLESIIKKAVGMGYEDDGDVLSAMTELNLKEINPKTEPDILNALDRNLNGEPSPFDKPAEPKEKADARKRVRECGYQDVAHNQLIKALCGDGADWNTATTGQISVVLGYAQAIHAAKEKLPDGFESIESYKIVMKEKAHQLVAQKQEWS